MAVVELLLRGRAHLRVSLERHLLRSHWYLHRCVGLSRPARGPGEVRSAAVRPVLGGFEGTVSLQVWNGKLVVEAGAAVRGSWNVWVAVHGIYERSLNFLNTYCSDRRLLRYGLLK